MAKKADLVRELKSIEKLENQLRVKIKEMEDLMSLFSKFGANDTEPDEHWQMALVKAAKGTLQVPESAIQWELFHSILASVDAAKMLTEKATEVCNWIIKNNTDGNLNEVVSQHCWRIHEIPE
jgi:hypothetical protein